MQGSPDGADAFICYGGVLERPEVSCQADWFVRSYDVLMASLKRYKVRACGVRVHVRSASASVQALGWQSVVRPGPAACCLALIVCGPSLSAPCPLPEDGDGGVGRLRVRPHLCAATSGARAHPAHPCLLLMQVAMVGSGAWACTAVRMVAQSTLENAQIPGSVFEPEVALWVHEEKHSGRNLIEVGCGGGGGGGR